MFDLRIFRFVILAVLTLLPLGGMAQAQHSHGSQGHSHDEVNMPGLRGLDASPEESREMMVMFRHFREIERSVEELPNGIRTVTTSRNPMVVDVLVSHVVGMIARVEEGRDPQVRIQSPTLDIFFKRGEAIETDISVSDIGVTVVQTSDDPEVVAALHVHAGEVTAMVDGGMHAVHQMMMKRGQGH